MATHHQEIFHAFEGIWYYFPKRQGTEGNILDDTNQSRENDKDSVPQRPIQHKTDPTKSHVFTTVGSLHQMVMPNIDPSRPLWILDG